MSKTLKNTADKIVAWYKIHARNLPWRHTKDPYKIWLSEIILQQTTVAQGTKYYLNFAEKYPTIKSFSKAPIDDILKLWQGLGYYSRARNMHFTAQKIMDNYDGIFPKEHKEILKLKGVGPYTAAAIASFAYNLSYPVVDGNVLRFMSRFYAIEKAIDLSETKKIIEKKANGLLKTQEPSVFNQAIMEFGALVCKAKNPTCEKCVLVKDCKSYKKDIVNKLPFKAKKITKKKRFFKFIFFASHDNKTIISKRSKKDIWQGLYQFPIQEFDSLTLDIPQLKTLGISILKDNIYPSKIYKQQLTHQTIHAQFYKIYIEGPVADICQSNQVIIKIEDLNKYAWPKIIDLYLNDLSLTLF